MSFLISALVVSEVWNLYFQRHVACGVVNHALQYQRVLKRDGNHQKFLQPVALVDVCIDDKTVSAVGVHFGQSRQGGEVGCNEVGEALRQRFVVKVTGDVNIPKVAVQAYEVDFFLVARLYMQGIQLVVVIGRCHGQSRHVNGTNGIVQRLGFEVCHDVCVKAGFTPLVRQVDGLWREVVEASLEVDYVGIVFPVYATFYLQPQVGVVNGQQACYQGCTVGTVNVDVVEQILVVLKSLHLSFGIDYGATVGRQSAFYVDVGGQQAEFVIGKQLLQIDALGVDVSFEGPLLVHLEIEPDLTDVGIKLTVYVKVSRSFTLGDAHQVHIAYTADHLGQFCPFAFQVLGDEIQGLRR